MGAELSCHGQGRHGRPYDGQDALMQVHLLGSVGFDLTMALQERLVYDAGEPRNAAVTLLLVEHPLCISIGRSGSRGHVRFSERELASRRMAIHWVGRGGGAMVHGPGQLAVYPIVHLERCGWTVGEYLRRFGKGLCAAMGELGLAVEEDRFGSLWSRTGPIGAMGVSVRYGVCLHGFWLNLNPDMYLAKRVVSVIGRHEGSNPEDAFRSDDRRSLSSVLSETGRPGKMNRVKTALVEQLAPAFDCEKYHLHTGHPLLQTDSLRT